MNIKLLAAFAVISIFTTGCDYHHDIKTEYQHISTAIPVINESGEQEYQHVFTAKKAIDDEDGVLKYMHQLTAILVEIEAHNISDER